MLTPAVSESRRSNGALRSRALKLTSMSCGRAPYPHRGGARTREGRDGVVHDGDGPLHAQGRVSGRDVDLLGLRLGDSSGAQQAKPDKGAQGSHSTRRVRPRGGHGRVSFGWHARTQVRSGGGG